MLKMKNQKLLIKLKEVETEKNGVIYTNNQNQKSFEGVIVAIGDMESGYDIGDVVVFSEFSGEDVWVDGHKYRIIEEENVWAVREEEGVQ